MLLIQGKAKRVHHHQAIIGGSVKGTYLRKKKIKTMNTKVAINSQWSKIESKKKTKVSKLAEQEQNHIWKSFGGLSVGT